MRGASALSFFWASMSTGRNPSAATAPAAHAHARKPTFGHGRGAGARCRRHPPRSEPCQPRSMTRLTTVPMMTAPNRYASSDWAITMRRISFVRTSLSPTW